MIKKLTTGSALIICAVVFGQVGINTDTPAATFDVTGKPTVTTTLDGIIAPRITGDQLRAKSYTGGQTGALVYVTLADTAPAGQTIDVTASGYYYFNGTKWVTTGAAGSPPVNIYNSDGSLTGSENSRTLTLNGKTLNFTGTLRNTYWDTAGRIHQETEDPASDAAMGFHGGNASLYLQQWYNASSVITASGNSTGLNLQTHYTNASAPITLSTSIGGNTSGVERMRITGEGNTGINTITPTEKLNVNGNVRLQNLPLNGATNAIYTASDGTASPSQNQTFTATRSIVSDDNGVLGYTNLSLPQNIYNTDGSLTGIRTLTNNGFNFTVSGTNQSTRFSSLGGILQRGIASSKRASVILQSDDNDSNGVVSSMFLFQDPENVSQIMVGGDSRALSLGSTNTTLAAPISFVTSTGSNASGTQKMILTASGNLGISGNSASTITEKLDVNGITRVRTLPLSGTTNAINTTSSGTLSPAQDQTFTATKTVVADANGVLGYVSGLPSTALASPWFNTATGTSATANTQNIYQMGKVGIMTNNPTALFHAYNTSSTTNPFTIESDNAGTDAGNDSYFYGYGTSRTPGLFFLSANGTKASPAVLGTGNLMGEYNFGGYLTSGWNYSLTSVRGSYDGDGNTLDSSLEFLTSSAVRMKIAANGNVGIGTSTPKSKVHVATGDVYVEQVGSGIIMKSPNGSCWRVTVSNTGTFSSATITCP